MKNEAKANQMLAGDLVNKIKRRRAKLGNVMDQIKKARGKKQKPKAGLKASY